MKWLHMLGALAVVLALGFVVTGCEDNDDDPLVGTWDVATIDGRALPDGVSMTVVLNKNGTGVRTMTNRGESVTFNFSWSKGAGVLVVVEGGDTVNIPYTLAGNMLTIVAEGDTIVLNRR